MLALYFTTLIFSLGVIAAPIVDDPLTLPLVKRVSLGGPGTLVQRDRARARALHKSALVRAGRASLPPLTPPPIPVINIDTSYYTAKVDVGNASTSYNLLIDTGSANTWIGADKSYVPTSSSKSTNDTVQVSYGSGDFSGKEFLDTVSLGPNLVIANQSIGVASSTNGFEGVDGILGIGPVGLTLGTLGSDRNGSKLISTVTDNLSSQKTIKSNLVAVSFQPPDENGISSGELTFGEVHPARFTGAIHYVPLTRTEPASDYWGIDQSISYGNKTTILRSTAGIVDTGTTLTLIATDAFEAYQKAIKGVMDDNTGLLRITTEQYDRLESLFFVIGGEKFELTPNAQIWPRSLNVDIGGDPGAIYLSVADIGTPSGNGLDFINGISFLDRFYSVFDSTNGRVGLATTLWTNGFTN